MNREGLRKALIRNRVNPQYYELDGNPEADMAYCLEQQEHTWYVYYTERGERHDEHVFDDENVACYYILGNLLCTETTRLDYGGTPGYRPPGFRGTPGI